MKWIKKHNIAYWALSLLLAAIVWLYVMVQLDPETTKLFTIHPQFVGAETLLAERDLAVVSGLDTEITIRVRGQRTGLAQCNENTIEAVADLSNITAAGNVTVNCVVKLPVEGLIIVSPASLQINLVTDRIETRTYDVHAEFVGTVAEGFDLEEILCDPSTVEVTGTASQLNKLAYLLVEPEKENLDKSLDMPMQFKLIDMEGQELPTEGLTFNPGQVTVALKVSRYKDVSLEVDLKEGGGALKSNAQVAVSPATIRLRGDPAVLESVNKIVLGTIDLSQLTDTAEQTFTILIPNDTTNESGETKATVTISLTGLSSRQFPVSKGNIYVEPGDLPDGMVATPVSDTVNVLVRGRAEVLALLNETNIQIVVRPTGQMLTQGRHSVAAEVLIEGYADVGAVGDLHVIIDVAPPAE